MQATFSELITQQNWELFSVRLGLDYIGLRIEKSDYELWNIQSDLKAEISLVGQTNRVRLLSIDPKGRKEDAIRAIRACSRKTQDFLLWIFRGEIPKLVFFDPSTRKTKSVDIKSIDTKDLDLRKYTEESILALFDSSEMTDKFFREFQSRHLLLTNSLEKGPENHEARKRIALIWLLRITFLYFAQAQGALNGDRNYLSKALKRFTKKEYGFQDSFLKVIFFDLLNTPRADRKSAAKKLGQIPFLNGGLFEPSLDELEWKEVCVRNSVWRVVFETLFEKYNFVPESGDLSDASSIDPEMLGKVFEALMGAGDRKRTGAFYTPRHIIRQMVEEGILGYLDDGLDIGVDSLRGDLREHPLRTKIIDRLNTLRVLDPAVGTGGFLVDALHLIRDLRRRLGLRYEGRAVQEITHRHLYGVDKNPVAIRLCELRFWLQILTAYRGSIEELPPLPNLSHRLVSGDTLLDPFEHFSSKVIREKWKGIARLQKEFSNAHGRTKQAIKYKIENEKKNLQLAELQLRKEKQIEEKTLIDAALKGRDLLGDLIKATPLQREALRKNMRNERELGELEERVNRSSEASLFSYHSHFPEVMRRGGFDVVLMNPPWVRNQHIPIRERKLLEKRYRSTSSHLWDASREQNVRSRYGSQCDLSSMFLERASELCRPTGRVVALVPSKVLRGISNAPIRGMLGNLDLQSLCDLSESGQQMFDATTYPAIISYRNQSPDGVLRASTTAVSGEKRNANEVILFGDDTRAPWTCGPADLVRAIRRLSSIHRPLGSFKKLQPRRGIYTGANEVFVKEKGVFPDSFSPFLRPLVEGKGRKRELLYLYDEKGKPLEKIPKEIEKYLNQHRGKLVARSDYKSRKAMWQIFRNHPDLFGPKIIWKDISKWFEPELDLSSAVPLNTVYLIACRDPELGARLLSYFKSDFVQCFIRLLAERVRGGHRRHFAWTVQCIPIPESVVFGSGEGLGLTLDEKQLFGNFIKNEKR